jgi:transcription elongation factor SPT5
MESEHENTIPSYESGSKTPAYGEAPTPGFNGLDQPTPGYGQYRTPAAAPTPGAFPETPGAWSAETPAGDGPGYD